MKNVLLEVVNLTVSVDSKIVLRDFSIKVRDGEVVALLGANGSGKSSLANFLLGNPKYEIRNPKQIRNTKPTSPKIIFEGKNLLKMRVDERAKAGFFVAWQSPIMIPGVSVFSLCKTAYELRGKKIEKLIDFKQKLEKLAIKVGLGKEYVSRGVNEGFSGGERKRLELLQLLLLEPKLAILDEIDSGLDPNGVERLVRIINKMKTVGTSFILITHNKKLLNEVETDQTWEMRHGQLQARI